jgi:hypothetical protein
MLAADSADGADESVESVLSVLNLSKKYGETTANYKAGTTENFSLSSRWLLWRSRGLAIYVLPQPGKDKKANREIKSLGLEQKKKNYSVKWEDL